MSGARPSCVVCGKALPWRRMSMHAKTCSKDCADTWDMRNKRLNNKKQRCQPGYASRPALDVNKDDTQNPSLRTYEIEGAGTWGFVCKR